jgi:hypothetical protein
MYNHRSIFYFFYFLFHTQPQAAHNAPWHITTQTVSRTPPALNNDKIPKQAKVRSPEGQNGLSQDHIIKICVVTLRRCLPQGEGNQSRVQTEGQKGGSEARLIGCHNQLAQELLTPPCRNCPS